VRKVYSDLLQRRLEALGTDGPPEGRNAIANENTRDLIEAPSEEYWTLVGEDDASRHLRWFAEQSGLAVETVEAQRGRILPEIHKALRSLHAELESAREGLGRLELGEGQSRASCHAHASFRARQGRVEPSTGDHGLPERA